VGAPVQLWNTCCCGATLGFVSLPEVPRETQSIRSAKPAMVARCVLDGPAAD
jgi:hypothetical protein